MMECGWVSIETVAKAEKCWGMRAGGAVWLLDKQQSSVPQSKHVWPLPEGILSMSVIAFCSESANKKSNAPGVAQSSTRGLTRRDLADVGDCLLLLALDRHVRVVVIPAG